MGYRLQMYALMAVDGVKGFRLEDHEAGWTDGMRDLVRWVIAQKRARKEGTLDDDKIEWVDRLASGVTEYVISEPHVNPNVVWKRPSFGRSPAW